MGLPRREVSCNVLLAVSAAILSYHLASVSSSKKINTFIVI
jgi:hypothetical protein